jgi:putative ABC transport system permease protein
MPLTGSHNYPAQEEGRIDHTIGGMEYYVVTADFLAAMGTPVVRGRNLNDRDTASSKPVALVSEEVARRWWPNENPLGHRVVWGLSKGKPAEGFADVPREVVGVVADTKGPFFKDPPRPTLYMPAAQTAWYDQGMNWVVRADLSPEIANRLRLAAADFDPRLRVQRMRTVDEIVAATTADSRFDAWLFGAFAALALVLTTVGVYGLLSFSVARRTAEIGTRMALGASRGDVLRMVLWQGVGLVAAGLVLGLAGAVVLTRSLQDLLFGVKATDPLSFACVAVLLLAVGLAASYFPARRATKVDPLVALRYE